MPKIFMSYRRDDSPAMAGWVHQNLVNRYGDGVFRDIDSIGPATNFRTAIARALRHTDVLVAIIGPKWRGDAGDGAARIRDERDWIRLEIEIALQLDIPIIPALVDNANMPTTGDLPDSLRDLPYINALRIDAGPHFETQIKKLMSVIDQASHGHHPNEDILVSPPQKDPPRTDPAPVQREPPPQDQKPPPVVDAKPGMKPRMFQDLMDFGLRRTALQALGWYLIYFLIGVAIGFVIGGIVGLASGGKMDVVGGIGIISAVIYHIVVGILLLAKRPKDAINILLVVAAIPLSMFLGALGGLIPLAYLTTRPTLWHDSGVPEIFR